METKIKEYVNQIPSDLRGEIIAGLQKCRSVEDMKELAEKYNLPITDEMIEYLSGYFSSEKLLSDDDLEAVTGGGTNFIHGVRC